MQLNTLRPAKGAKTAAKRVGRGIGSGLGKTAGRGHKGQHSRTGGGVKAGFEGGQMPLQRRLPKFGFASRSARRNHEVRLDSLARIPADVIDVLILKQYRVVPAYVERVKLIASGEITRAVTVRGLSMSKAARAALEAAGGRVEH